MSRSLSMNKTLPSIFRFALRKNNDKRVGKRRFRWHYEYRTLHKTKRTMHCSVEMATVVFEM